MAISESVQKALAGSSMIRKMFEEGLQLKKQYGSDKVFDFSLGNPDVDPPKEFQDTLVKLAAKNEKGSHGYMANAGYPFVRDALAKKINREQGVQTDASHVVMAAGAAAGLNAVFKAICNPGDEIIVPRPYFVEYRAYAANHQIKLVEADTLENFDLDIKAIGNALNEKTAAVLVNSPNNPTGKVYSAEALTSLAKIIKEHNSKGRVVYLISDEPYREIAYGIDVPPFLSCYDNSIVVSSYSKNLSLPGERIGYIAVNPAISDKDNLINGIVYCLRVLGFVNAPALMQRIVAELTEAAVDIDIYAKRRDAFMKVLDKAGIQYAIPEGAFYLFCKVPETGKSDTEFADHLKKHLILGVPGSAFGKPGWLRFAYCVDEKTIAASADAFMQAVESWK
ncbi:MAG: pyridoxal phosphate-dependent aminotransferase [Treponema sp.]|jgi:aspartate aminotransferase|nr:pyridoxal phosphate-dependent aminotransferase [Treponema sp.]